MFSGVRLAGPPQHPTAANGALICVNSKRVPLGTALLLCGISGVAMRNSAGTLVRNMNIALLAGNCGLTPVKLRCQPTCDFYSARKAVTGFTVVAVREGR